MLRSRPRTPPLETSQKVPPLKKGTRGSKSPPSKTLFSGQGGICTILSVFVGLGLFVFSVGYIIRTNQGDSVQLSPMRRAVTPIQLPRVLDLPQFGGDYDEKMFWGTYRPHLYLGIRTRRPKSLLMGLMWVAPIGNEFKIRHTCEEGDKLRKYGWTQHDGREYGTQEIIDGNHRIGTTFVKSFEDDSGFGGDWAVSISVEKMGGNDVVDLPLSVWDDKVALFLYFMDERGSPFKFWPQKGKDYLMGGGEGGGKGGGGEGDDGPFLTGEFPELGKWEFHIRGLDKKVMSWQGMKTRHTHNLTQQIQKEILGQYEGREMTWLSNNAVKDSNLGIIQIVGQLPSTVEAVFLSGKDKKEKEKKGKDKLGTETETDTERSVVRNRVEKLHGLSLTQRAKKLKESFDRRYKDIFQDLPEKQNAEDEKVAKGALSNLIGGMGYFFGQSRIAILPEFQVGSNKSKGNYLHYWAAPLYTAVPSRSFFPRGFLWDEGFHQLILNRWDYKLSLDAMGHWLDLINVDGWIPREQILGSEARSKVPDEFVLQHTSNANPPTLFLPLRVIALRLEKGTGDKVQMEEERAFLEKAFPRLQAWYRWYNTTQIGKVPGSYYWHGRDATSVRELNPKTLQSGLDDYPRSSHPSSDERHTDLRCWMSLASETMTTMAKILRKPYKEYENTASVLRNIENFNKLHLDPKTGRYYDFGNHTEKVKLLKREYVDQRTGWLEFEGIRKVSKKPKLRFVPHFGYVSLFPLIMKILPASETEGESGLSQQLELLRREDLLWTPQGLRSLAKDSSMYMQGNTLHDAPYWRGPIWININYLTLSALHHYSQVPGPNSARAKELHDELRACLIRNIREQYYETGYLWEQYDDSRGKGKGSHPFTGWTALFVLILAELY